jgi:serine/threonine protein kinase
VSEQRRINADVPGGADYVGLLVQMGLVPVQRSVWAHVGTTSGEYGWKFHLSAVQTNAFALLESVLPVLIRRNAAFKIARRGELLGMLNEGALGPTQVGKFMTVYPSQDSREINELAAELITVTSELKGPKVQTDLHLGGVVYARYGSFSPATYRDRLGFFVTTDHSDKGAYRIPFVPPEGVPNPFDSFIPPQLSTPASLKLLGPGYLVTGILHTHPKGAVLTALDLQCQESVRRVVLKEGRAFCMSDKHGRDMWFRLRNQAHAHNALASSGIVPPAGELFEQGGSLYLPLEHVEGRDLGARPALPYRALKNEDQKAILNELRTVFKAVQRIHESGYAHRDLSMRNIRVTPSGQIMLLDFEISYCVARPQGPPLSEGTRGFVSPQQVAGETASISDDLFALGSIIICLITGLDPHRVLYAQTPHRAAQIEALSGAHPALCALAATCVSDDAELRPSACACHDVVTEILASSNVPAHDSPTPNPDSLRPLVIEGLHWLLRTARRDRQTGMWLSPDLDSGEHASLKLVNNYRVYRSANRGVAGVLYTISKLHRFGFRFDQAREEAEKAVDWLLGHQDTPDDQLPGLHFGEAGVAVTMSETIAAGLIEQGPWFNRYMEEALCGPLDWPDLTHGAAGQGMAAIICSQLLGRPEFFGAAGRCAAFLLDSQSSDGSWVLPEGVRAMSGSVYTGFAHGVAGIISFLASYARFADSDSARAAAERGGQWLLETARPGPLGLSLWWPLNPQTNEAWAWWCHGAPGISLAFVALFELTGKLKYAAAVRACLRGHPKDVRNPNMSQCHGLSGLGEILIEAHRVLREEEWLQRAQTLGQLLSNLVRREPAGASWLVENPYQATPDLMIGTGGVIHFLARLQCGPDAGFGLPLMPAQKP